MVNPAILSFLPPFSPAPLFPSPTSSFFHSHPSFLGKLCTCIGLLYKTVIQCLISFCWLPKSLTCLLVYREIRLIDILMSSTSVLTGYQDYQPHLQCSDHTGHTADFVHTSFNWCQLNGSGSFRPITKSAHDHFGRLAIFYRLYRKLITKMNMSKKKLNKYNSK